MITMLFIGIHSADDNALLVAELYRAGFETKDSKVHFVLDFD